MKYLFFFAFLASLFSINIYSQSLIESESPYKDSSRTMDFSYLRYKVYTFKPYYLDVDLVTQKGYLHSRDGKVKVFGISSGTDKMNGGINTNEGLFVVQAKLPEWYSRQFDSTLMLNWIGFNFGIGFHALQTSGYYVYLGKGKSSHGCIRVSRPIAKELYKLIDKGTPVLVHSENNIVEISFADSSMEFESYSYKELKDKINAIYEEMYSGRYFMSNHPLILISHSNVHHQGLPIGDSNNILKRQIIKSPYEFLTAIIPDYK